MKSIVILYLWSVLALFFSKKEQDGFLFAPDIIQCNKGKSTWVF